MSWIVTPIRYGTLAPVPPAPVGWAPVGDGAAFELPVFGYLVRDAERGSSHLVDLGPSCREEALRSGRTVVTVPWISASEAVSRAGVNPSDVESVIFTHLHWDHVHGLNGFKNATVVVQRAEMTAATDPASSQSAAYDALPWFDPTADGRRVRLLDGDTVLAEGLRCLALPGHTPGSQALLVDTAEGQVALCGDLAHRYENLLGSPVSPGLAVPPGLRSSAGDWFASVNRLAALGAIPLLAHDERSAAVMARGARLTGSRGRYHLMAAGAPLRVGTDLPETAVYATHERTHHV